MHIRYVRVDLNDIALPLSLAFGKDKTRKLEVSDGEIRGEKKSEVLLSREKNKRKFFMMTRNASDSKIAM